MFGELKKLRHSARKEKVTGLTRFFKTGKGGIWLGYTLSK